MVKNDCFVLHFSVFHSETLFQSENAPLAVGMFSFLCFSFIFSLKLCCNVFHTGKTSNWDFKGGNTDHL